LRNSRHLAWPPIVAAGVILAGIWLLAKAITQKS